MSNAFDAFKGEIGANKDLFEISSLLKYWDAAKQHASYSEVAATPTGAPPTTLVANWITAAARDIADNDDPSTSSTRSPSSSTSPQLTPSSSGPSSYPTTTSGTTTSSQPSGTSTAPSPSTDSDLPPFLTGEDQ